MSDGKGVHLHIKKFRRWKNLLPPETRVLAGLVETILVPKVIAQGYEVRDIFYNDPEFRVSGSEIHLERHSGHVAFYITFSFAKYRRPKFQVHLGKKQVVEPREIFLRGNLVSRPTLYYQWWGKPWWMPKLIWSDKRAEKLVKVVADNLDRAFHFLDSGVRNSNISRPVIGKWESADGTIHVITE